MFQIRRRELLGPSRHDNFSLVHNALLSKKTYVNIVVDSVSREVGKGSAGGVVQRLVVRRRVVF